MSGDLMPMFVGIALVLAILYWVGATIYRWIRPAGGITATGPLICATCGSRGTPRTRTRGSTWLELALWLCFIVPGLIYSIWRLTTRQPVCPECGSAGMISVNTPRGKQLAAQYGKAT